MGDEWSIYYKVAVVKRFDWSDPFTQEWKYSNEIDSLSLSLKVQLHQPNRAGVDGQHGLIKQKLGAPPLFRPAFWNIWHNLC